MTDINQALREADAAMEKAYETLSRQKAELETQLAVVTQSLAGVIAYRRAKEGDTPPPVVPTAPKRTRAPKEGGVKQKVLDMIRSRESGMTSGDLAAFLEMDDKAGKQAIANALQMLKKDNAIHQPTKRGPYLAVENPQADQEEAA